jgi:hypothetical protein
MRNRKFIWLSLMTLPGVLMSGCWAGLHELAIHGFEFLGAWADLTTLGVV